MFKQNKEQGGRGWGGGGGGQASWLDLAATICNREQICKSLSKGLVNVGMFISLNYRILRSLIYISLDHKSANVLYILRSSKHFDTSKTGGPKWPCIQ